MWLVLFYIFYLFAEDLTMFMNFLEFSEHLYDYYLELYPVDCLSWFCLVISLMSWLCLCSHVLSRSVSLSSLEGVVLCRKCPMGPRKTIPPFTKCSRIVPSVGCMLPPVVTGLWLLLVCWWAGLTLIRAEHWFRPRMPTGCDKVRAAVGRGVPSGLGGFYREGPQGNTMVRQMVLSR